MHTFLFASQAFFFFFPIFFLLVLRLSLICLLLSSLGRKQGRNEGRLCFRRRAVNLCSGNMRSFSCLALLPDFSRVTIAGTARILEGLRVCVRAEFTYDLCDFIKPLHWLLMKELL